MIHQNALPEGWVQAPNSPSDGPYIQHLYNLARPSDVTGSRTMIVVEFNGGGVDLRLQVLGSGPRYSGRVLDE